MVSIRRRGIYANVPITNPGQFDKCPITGPVALSIGRELVECNFGAQCNARTVSCTLYGFHSRAIQRSFGLIIYNCSEDIYIYTHIIYAYAMRTTGVL